MLVGVRPFATAVFAAALLLPYGGHSSAAHAQPLAPYQTHAAPRPGGESRGNPSPATTAARADGCASVLDYGAHGDGAHDDTAAFRNAVAAVANTSGCVLVPACAIGLGYVLTGTVSVPAGVSVVGQPAALTYGNGKTGGSIVLARPASMREPLFHITWGVTLRGMHILYDTMPYPSNADFANKSSRFYYPSYADAKLNFYTDHVPLIGPTIYVVDDAQFVVEDISAAMFRDFLYCKRCGQSHVTRVRGFGYGAMIAVEWNNDVISFTEVHYHVNTSPYIVGHGWGTPNFTWAPAIIAASPGNVGIWMGRADGYVAREIFFFGINTGMRFGYASGTYMMQDPVTGGPGVPHDPKGADGPWGSVSNLLVDQCQIGLHFVWPTTLFNRFSNVQLHPAYWDGRTFPAHNATGESPVGLEAAVVVEDTHVRANNANNAAVMLLANLAVQTFVDTAQYGSLASTVMNSNGRIFLVNGMATFDVSGFASTNIPDADTRVVAAGAAADYSLRMRGVVLHDGKLWDDIVRNSTPLPAP